MRYYLQNTVFSRPVILEAVPVNSIFSTVKIDIDSSLSNTNAQLFKELDTVRPRDGFSIGDFFFRLTNAQNETQVNRLGIFAFGAGVKSQLVIEFATS